jgi:hypothetical protein
MKTLDAAGFNQIGIETARLYGLEDARAKIVAYPDPIRSQCMRFVCFLEIDETRTVRIFDKSIPLR